jgi:DNA replication protein DnaC
MPHTNILQEFKELKLYGMADAFLELTQSTSKQSELPKVWIESLLKSEIADRKVRSINYQMGAAKFPVHRDISNFDFESSVVLENKIRLCDAGHGVEEGG